MSKFSTLKNLQDTADSASTYQPSKKNKTKQNYYSNETQNNRIAPDLYYTTLPANLQGHSPSLSPYATLPVPQPFGPVYLNTNMGNIPGSYMNYAPPALSYNLGDPYGAPIYPKPAELDTENKVLEFEVIVKGVIIFILTNSFVRLVPHLD